MNRELSDVQAGFRKVRGTRDQLANIHWTIEKAREFQKKICFCTVLEWLWGDSPRPRAEQETSRKTFTSALLTMPKPLTVWITTNSGKFFKRWKYQTTWPASWEAYMQVRKQQLELDMEQQTDSKLEKECVKAIYCHPVYRIHHVKCWAGWSTSWNQDCQEKYQ